MANIKVELIEGIANGQPVTFVAPCNCTEITGLKVVYPGGSKVFTFKDAHGNNLTGLGNLFSRGAYVKAVLDTMTNSAYLQNADTNKYLEEKLNDRLSKTGGTMTGTLTLKGIILTEGVDYGTEEQRPAPGIKGRIYFQKVPKK